MPPYRVRHSHSRSYHDLKNVVGLPSETLALLGAPSKPRLATVSSNPIVANRYSICFAAGAKRGTHALCRLSSERNDGTASRPAAIQ
jgi:hypothetical protein